VTACPSCGEPLASPSLAFCDRCGARLQPAGGLLMLGSSIGALPASAAPIQASPSPAADQPSPEPQRFVPFASRRALPPPR
jgi:hypothetical protein